MSQGWECGNVAENMLGIYLAFVAILQNGEQKGNLVPCPQV